MKITQVIVGSHEKRNHPHEYGHADAELTLTAAIDEGDDVGKIIVALRNMTRSHVNAELDNWLAEIKNKRQQAQLRNQVDELIRDTHWARTEEQLQQRWTDALRYINLLPGQEQKERIDALNAAANECRESWRVTEPDDDPLDEF